MFHKTLYLRREECKTEHRAPLVPMDVGRLVQRGYEVYVQSAQDQRVYSDEAYATVGAKITTLPWHNDLFRDALHIGLKQIPDIDRLCNHTHAYFSHSFRGQITPPGSDTVVDTFRKTSSVLYDFEYLVDANGRRVLAFGEYAGMVGAGLGLLQYFARVSEDTFICHLQSWTSTELFEVDMRAVADCLRLIDGSIPRIAILGPRGRCGRAVGEFLDKMGFHYEGLGREDDKRALLDRFDIIYNCILLSEDETGEGWITADSAEDQIDHKVLVDISCDANKQNNPFRELYQEVGTWDHPVFCVAPFVDALVLDNLPSLVPVSSSIAFSGVLTDLLLSEEEEEKNVWARSRAEFERVAQHN